MSFLHQGNPVFGPYPQCSSYKTLNHHKWSYWNHATTEECQISLSFLWPCRLLSKINQEFCSNCKTTYNSYVIWCKIWLDTEPPSIICQPERSSHTSTHTSLPRPCKVVHSLHGCLWWCLWCSTINRNTMTRNYQSHFSYIHSWTHWK